MMNERNLPLSLTYRAELLEQVMPLLQAGECCSIVGISGVGKSNLIRFILRHDVQSRYWSDRMWTILIDSHSLVFGEQPADYAVVELMIHRLILEAESRGLPTEIIAWAEDLQARLIAQANALLALRYLERICARFCEMMQLQLVFIFDQFEDLWRTIDARLFLNLRNLRDLFKYQIVYLVITRDRLQRTRNDLNTVEAFWELFASHVFGLGMHSERDAQMQLARLAARRSENLDPDLAGIASLASGRHPGLLRATFWALRQMQPNQRATMNLLDVPAISEECAKIWHDLSPDEQKITHSIATGIPLCNADGAVLSELRLKQVIDKDSPRLFGPIFNQYVQRLSDSNISGVLVDIGLRQVWLDGQPLEKPLSPLEFSLLAYLARHVETVCQREDILLELYQDSGTGINDERLDTLLRRLREALHEDGRSPRYLITHRGVGVQLLRGQLRE